MKKGYLMIGAASEDVLVQISYCKHSLS